MAIFLKGLNFLKKKDPTELGRVFCIIFFTVVYPVLILTSLSRSYKTLIASGWFEGATNEVSTQPVNEAGLDEGQDGSSEDDETISDTGQAELPETSSEQSDDSQTNGENGSSQLTDQGGTSQEEETQTPPPPPPADPIKMLCLGDSVTSGVPYTGTSYTYPARLQSKLNAAYGSGKVSVINKGVGGYTADQVLASTNSWLNSYGPDIVLLMVGGNDLKTATPMTFLSVVSQTVSEVQQIINTVKAYTNPAGQKPRVVVSAFIPNRYEGVWGSAGVAVYNSAMQSSLSGYDKYFTSNWSDLYNSSEGMAYSSLMYDETHPNTTGYSYIADNWYAQVVGYVN